MGGTIVRAVKSRFTEERPPPPPSSTLFALGLICLAATLVTVSVPRQELAGQTWSERATRRLKAKSPVDSPETFLGFLTLFFQDAASNDAQVFVLHALLALATSATAATLTELGRGPVVHAEGGWRFARAGAGLFPAVAQLLGAGATIAVGLGFIARKHLRELMFAPAPTTPAHAAIALATVLVTLAQGVPGWNPDLTRATSLDAASLHRLLILPVLPALALLVVPLGARAVADRTSRASRATRLVVVLTHALVAAAAALVHVVDGFRLARTTLDHFSSNVVRSAPGTFLAFDLVFLVAATFYYAVIVDVDVIYLGAGVNRPMFAITFVPILGPGGALSAWFAAREWAALRGDADEKEREIAEEEARAYVRAKGAAGAVSVAPSKGAGESKGKSGKVKEG